MNSSHSAALDASTRIIVIIVVLPLLLGIFLLKIALHCFPKIYSLFRKQVLSFSRRSRLRTVTQFKPMQSIIDATFVKKQQI